MGIPRRNYVRAHQHASGAQHGQERAIGKSRGGATTKIHIAADSHGNPLDFEITGGDVHDIKAAPSLIKKIDEAENCVADKGYDSNEFRKQLLDSGMNPIIPRKCNSIKQNIWFDRHIYKLRHLVENLFARLKHFRSIATRYEKLARNFRAMTFLACTMIWVKLK